MSSYPMKNGKWICIEGVAGTGKTLLGKRLVDRFDAAILAPEFSGGRFGSLLKQAFLTDPHIISQSLLEQSLIILADFFRIYETFVMPTIDRGGIVISDRGYSSKYAYQLVILADAYGSVVAQNLMDAMFCFIKKPDFTILLTCQTNTLKERLTARDGEECWNDQEVLFLEKLKTQMHQHIRKSDLQYTEIEQDSSTTIDDVLGKASLAIDRFLAE